MGVGRGSKYCSIIKWNDGTSKLESPPEKLCSVQNLTLLFSFSSPPGCFCNLGTRTVTPETMGVCVSPRWQWGPKSGCAFFPHRWSQFSEDSPGVVKGSVNVCFLMWTVTGFPGNFDYTVPQCYWLTSVHLWCICFKKISTESKSGFSSLFGLEHLLK